ncbi:hypothetical protein R3P38DRAFT_2899467 [Favolaschia claudopus]|uniref:Secreted protein n=1 Tax=Favolaschia claudopus TaxID=2862362 RepID=A0AAW0CN20_9AGAR
MSLWDLVSVFESYVLYLALISSLRLVSSSRVQFFRSQCGSGGTLRDCGKWAIENRIASVNSPSSQNAEDEERSKRFLMILSLRSHVFRSAAGYLGTRSNLHSLASANWTRWRRRKLP